jgi:hypothetical protein
MTTRLEQLEQNTEQSRADLAGTLRELKSRMTPGQILDDAIDYFHEGEVAAMVSNLRRQAVDNPLALALLGFSLAWLISPKRAFSSTNNPTSRLRKVKHTALDASERLSGSVQAMAEKARSAGYRIADATETVTGAAASTGKTVYRGYNQFARSAKATSARTRRRLRTAKRDPWLLLALGLVVVATAEAVSRTEPRR